MLTFNLIAQDIAKNSNELVEKVSIITDRDIYSVLETVNFRAFNLSSKDIKDIEWSKVLYVEIITCEGQAVYQGKFRFGKNGSNGSFIIPNEIITGNYYLKAYTKWMRNYSNTDYYYQPICIINPFNKELNNEPNLHLSELNFDTVYTKKAEYISCTIPEDISKSNSKVSLSVIQTPIKNTTDNYEITINGETISINQSELSKFKDIIGDIEKPAKQKTINYTATIVSKNTNNSEYFLKLKNNNKTDFNFEYIPETRGISISGSIVTAEEHNPVTSTPLYLTVFSKPKETLSVISDSIGQFHFSLPELYGINEIFISTESSLNIKTKILVDNDFCTKSIYLPYVPLDLTDELWKLYNKMSLNSQIKNQYKVNDDLQIKEDADIKTQSNLYNTPTLSVKLDDFIKLPTLIDYFHELIPLVMIYEKDGKSQMEVFGLFSELKVHSPLILIDNVNVTDVDKLLKINPDNIYSVEVLQYPYIIGDLTYGGIINITSKEGDLGGLELPSSSQFFTYKMFSNKQTQDGNSSISLLSNTLYWNPNLEFNKQNNNSIEFNTGFNKGSFNLIIKGIDDNGDIYNLVKEFSINH